MRSACRAPAIGAGIWQWTRGSSPLALRRPWALVNTTEDDSNRATEPSQDPAQPDWACCGPGGCGLSFRRSVLAKGGSAHRVLGGCSRPRRQLPQSMCTTSPAITRRRPTEVVVARDGEGSRTFPSAGSLTSQTLELVQSRQQTPLAANAWIGAARRGSRGRPRWRPLSRHRFDSRGRFSGEPSAGT